MPLGQPIDRDRVLELLKAGKSNAEIAEEMGCTESAIANLKTRLRKEGRMNEEKTEETPVKVEVQLLTPEHSPPDLEERVERIQREVVEAAGEDPDAFLVSEHGERLKGAGILHARDLVDRLHELQSDPPEKAIEAAIRAAAEYTATEQVANKQAGLPADIDILKQQIARWAEKEIESRNDESLKAMVSDVLPRASGMSPEEAETFRRDLEAGKVSMHIMRRFLVNTMGRKRFLDEIGEDRLKAAEERQIGLERQLEEERKKREEAERKLEERKLEEERREREEERKRRPFFPVHTTEAQYQKVFATNPNRNYLREILESLPPKWQWDDPDALEKNAIGVWLRYAEEEPGQLEIQFPVGFDMDRDGFHIVPAGQLDTPETAARLETLAAQEEARLIKLLDPLCLKVKDATTMMAYDEQTKRFTVSENDLLNLLGYTLDNKGYHQTINQRRVRERLEVLGQTRFKFAARWRGYDARFEDQIMTVGKASIRKGRGRARTGYVIEFTGSYWDILTSNQFFALLDRRCLQVNTQKHRRAYHLYRYLALRWRMHWRKFGGVYSFKLEPILREAGVGIPGDTNLSRDMREIEKDLEHLKDLGLLKGWKRLHQENNPLMDRWNFEAPDQMKAELSKIGQRFKEAEAQKSLPAKGK